jgi:hypothetical protein
VCVPMPPALFVEPGYESCGIGRRLHDTMMEWFFAAGVPEVWSDSIHLPTQLGRGPTPEHGEAGMVPWEWWAQRQPINNHEEATSFVEVFGSQDRFKCRPAQDAGRVRWATRVARGADAK